MSGTMGRYYLTTTYSGHFKTLKVKYSNKLNSNYDEYICFNNPNDDAQGRLQAELWRDDVITAICNASTAYNAHMGSNVTPLNPTDFTNYNVPYDQQQ